MFGAKAGVVLENSVDSFGESLTPYLIYGNAFFARKVGQ
jgi:hypothetical protein